jgi:hypothetical protein
MFEQLVRPFQSRQVTTTRRIVPAVHKPDEKPDEAKITWGSTGALPQGKVQPKSTNLENIESVGFNLRGNIDNFHQSVREGEEVDVPIRDNSGNQIGTATLDRATSITYNNKNLDPGRDPYLQQFGYNQNFVPTNSPTATTPTGSGIRASVPSNDVSQRTDTYSYP